MQYREMNRPLLLLLFVFALLCAGVTSSSMFAKNESSPGTSAFASPSPTPHPREEIPQDSDEVIKVETNLTNIFFTAADKNKRFISSLKAEDIRVLEDGQPQEIFTFQQNIDLPLSLAILIDTSASEERTLPDEKIAARAFLENVLRANKDEAAILSFTGETTLEQGFTGNVERLRRAIDRVEFVPPSGYIGGGVVVNGTPPISGENQMLAGSTAIWDAVWATSEELIGTSAEHTRRAIILLTDGRAYFPRHERDLRDAFTQIQRDLREQYLVAYSPKNNNRDGSYRKIEIQIVNPELKQQNLKLN